MGRGDGHSRFRGGLKEKRWGGGGRDLEREGRRMGGAKNGMNSLQRVGLREPEKKEENLEKKQTWGKQ